MKNPDLQIYEAAREYLAALEYSEDLVYQAKVANNATYDRKRDLIKLLHELFDIEETFCLRLTDGELLVCHYDGEEGFIDFSQIQEFSENLVYAEPVKAAPKKRLYRPIYSSEFIEVPDDFDPETADLNAIRAKYYGDEILLGGIDSETDA